MGAKLHAEGRTNMTKLIVAFRSFANAPEICWKKGKVESISVHAQKACREVEVQLHAFLTSSPDGGEWSDSRLRPS